ncbi:hypothetical protein DFQ14_10298 [Halopolyspora algeriensis]|uniref:Uncharacterized protein n=1 Tax=Halopolyspora algeriensis TaxID=1500506 RepID=A0A368VWW2_9ACTN|nr:hypothetical protein [Halopolyspora algeriensis]RCW45797.1 hypothetical protein DFQ14_10298 [Halopolyspora algeriensis]TQM54181.1 hypothetical protein FHU43_2360 [Halopolyspora algeriensis]
MSFEDARAALTSLSDVERRIAEGVLFGSATRSTETGSPRLAQFWRALAETVVDERDRRRELEDHARSVLEAELSESLGAEFDETRPEPPDVTR